MTACPDRQDDLSALTDDALPPEEARRLEEHLAECAGCRAEREALQQVAQQVRGLPRRAPPAFFTAAVMAKVVEEEAPPPDVVLLVEEPPPPAAAPAAGPAAPCEAWREELTAHVDRELEGEALAKLEAHLAACPACDAAVWVEERLRARVRTLPRLAPHDLFVRQVMAKLEAEDLARADQARRQAAERARRWQVVGWGLRAASLLAAVALSLQLTGPEDLPEGGLWLPPPSPSAASYREAPPPPEPPPPPVPPPLAGAFDATLELHSPQGLDAGYSTALSVASGLGSIAETRVTDVQRELAVVVPANLVDDLYLRCDQSAELDGTPEAARVVEEVATEQDRVVLRTGIVLAGRVEAESRQAVEVTTAGMRQAIRRDRVEKIVRASEARRVRVVVRGEAR